MYLFENLDIYNQAVGFAAVLKRTTEGFPYSLQFFADRVIRAGDSIHESLAAAHSRFNEGDRKDCFWSAQQAVMECAGLVEIAANAGLMGSKDRVDFRIQLTRLTKLVQNLIRGYGPEAVSAGTTQ